MNNNKNLSLAVRMKEYEFVNKYRLMKKNPVIIRL